MRSIEPEDEKVKCAKLHALQHAGGVSQNRLPHADRAHILEEWITPEPEPSSHTIPPLEQASIDQPIPMAGGPELSEETSPSTICIPSAPLPHLEFAQEQMNAAMGTSSTVAGLPSGLPAQLSRPQSLNNSLSFEASRRVRTEARVRQFCALNRAGNALCAWHETRRERRAYPPRGAPDGVLNCGCTYDEALFEESLARNGVGSYLPGDSARMDPALRNPLLRLLQDRYGYQDGDFERDAVTGAWKENEGPLFWEQRSLLGVATRRSRDTQSRPPRSRSPIGVRPVSSASAGSSSVAFYPGVSTSKEDDGGEDMQSTTLFSIPAIPALLPTSEELQAFATEAPTLPGAAEVTSDADSKWIDEGEVQSSPKHASIPDSAAAQGLDSRDAITFAAEDKPTICVACQATSTSEWRRNHIGQPLCNACGLVFLVRASTQHRADAQGDVVSCRRSSKRSRTRARARASRSTCAGRVRRVVHTGMGNVRQRVGRIV
jgi:hypothetical protein